MSLIQYGLYFVVTLCWVFTWLLVVMIAGGYKTLGEWSRGIR